MSSERTTEILKATGGKRKTPGAAFLARVEGMTQRRNPEEERHQRRFGARTESQDPRVHIGDGGGTTAALLWLETPCTAA